MADSAKGHAALLIALGGKPKGMPPSDKPDEAPDEKEPSAGDDILDAIASKDGEALLEAVKRIVHECLAEGEDDKADEHEDY